MAIRDYLELAMQVAKEAGDYALGVQKSDLLVQTKTTGTDIVTQVDTRNEAEIRKTVQSIYPDHEFLGEEMGASVPESSDGKERVRWIIDPIDGTVNFAHGLPIWCVSVGVEVNGIVECGAIYNPNMNEMFSVLRGEGAYLNGQRIYVSKVSNQQQSLFVTGFPYHVNENPGKVIEQFVAFLSRGLLIRRLGSAALDLAYVACGRFEAFWEAYLSPWDTSAGQLMVREAGGVVTHYSGEDFNIYNKSIIASNGIHHPMIQSVIDAALKQYHS